MRQTEIDDNVYYNCLLDNGNLKHEKDAIQVITTNHVFEYGKIAIKYYTPALLDMLLDFVRAKIVYKKLANPSIEDGAKYLKSVTETIQEGLKK